MEVKYSTLPSCRSYHPRSELSKLPGYYPNLSPVQLAAASQLSKLVSEENLQFNIDEEDEYLKLLRFLRARKYNVKNAFAMVKDDVRWRCENNRLQLRKESAVDVLACDIHKIYSYFPVWFQGHDKQLRPVSYRQFGKFEVWNVLKLTTMERLVRFHAWESEQALRSMHALSASSGYNIETFVLVIDAAGWGLRLATSDAFAFIKGMAVTDSDHYPERLGTMVIVNAPAVLSFAWRVIQGFLDPVTKEKIRILSCDPEEWQPVLRHYIDEDQIPRQYGGTAPDLTAQQAIDAMNPPTAAAAAVEEVSAAAMQATTTAATKGYAVGDPDVVGVTMQASANTDRVCATVCAVPSTAEQGTQTDDGVYVLEEELKKMHKKKRLECCVM